MTEDEAVAAATGEAAAWLADGFVPSRLWATASGGKHVQYTPIPSEGWTYLEGREQDSGDVRYPHGYAWGPRLSVAGIGWGVRGRAVATVRDSNVAEFDLLALHMGAVPGAARRGRQLRYPVMAWVPRWRALQLTANLQVGLSPLWEGLGTADRHIAWNIRALNEPAVWQAWAEAWWRESAAWSHLGAGSPGGAASVARELLYDTAREVTPDDWPKATLDRFAAWLRWRKYGSERASIKTIREWHKDLALVDQMWRYW